MRFCLYFATIAVISECDVWIPIGKHHLIGICGFQIYHNCSVFRVQRPSPMQRSQERESFSTMGTGVKSLFLFENLHIHFSSRKGMQRRSGSHINWTNWEMFPCIRNLTRKGKHYCIWMIATNPLMRALRSSSMRTWSVAIIIFWLWIGHRLTKTNILKSSFRISREWVCWIADCWFITDPCSLLSTPFSCRLNLPTVLWLRRVPVWICRSCMW